MEKIFIITTTFSSRNDAETVAKKVLNKRLAACVQLSDRITSFYWWKDALETADEFILTLKTREKVYQKLETYLKEIHPYVTPEIMVVSIEHCEADYRDWLIEETPAED